MIGLPLGNFFCEGPKTVTNVGGNHHVNVVMNHNRQEETMATNFTGSTSHLAFSMTLLLVL